MSNVMCFQVPDVAVPILTIMLGNRHFATGSFNMNLPSVAGQKAVPSMEPLFQVLNVTHDADHRCLRHFNRGQRNDDTHAIKLCHYSTPKSFLILATKSSPSVWPEAILIFRRVLSRMIPQALSIPIV